MRDAWRRVRPICAAVVFGSAFTAASAATYTPIEQANKQAVLDFYAALNEADATHTLPERIQGIAERYLSPDYIQHAEAFANLPGPGSARDRLIRMFQHMPPMPRTISAPKLVAVMAEQDRVILVTSRDMPDPATGGSKPGLIWNMFRVKDGRLAEHWDAMPAMGGPPPQPGHAPAGSAASPPPR